MHFVMFAGAGRALAYHVASGDQLGKEGFVQYCAKHYGDIAVTGSAGAIQSLGSGGVWWDWKDATKRVVRRVVMEPTNEPESLYGDVFNRWHVLRHEMEPPEPDATVASIRPLIEHLMYVSDDDVAGVAYFLNWLAWLWQHPEAKIPTAIMMYSRFGGVGKSILAKLLGHVFGKSLVKSCTGAVLHKNFHDAIEHKRIMVLNELAKADKLDDYENFKSLISEETMEFEGKGRASKEVANCAHFIITTNNADCLPLMMGDRRIAVLRCEKMPKAGPYYVALVEWIEGPGPGLVAGVLKNWTFPAGWDPYGTAPQTEAAKRTQQESRNGLAVFIDDLVNTGRVPFDKDIGRCTSIIEQLNTLYPGNVRSLRVNNRTLPYVFAVLGYKQMHATYLTPASTKVSTAIWCWRNREKWEGRPGADIGDYLTD